MADDKQVELADVETKKQIKVYNIEICYDNFCYTTEEKMLREENGELCIKLKKLKDELNEKTKIKINSNRDKISKIIKDEKGKEKRKNILSLHRVLAEKSFYSEKEINKIIALKQSTLTRAIVETIKDINTEIIILQKSDDVKVTDEFINSIIKNGFELDNKQYTFFVSTSGQTKVEKLTFVQLDLLTDKVKNHLTCGLGFNYENYINIIPNKFEGYLGLSMSDTKLWEEFNQNKWLDKAIVVKDFENVVKGLPVDMLDYKTYDIKRVANCDVSINQTDGCGMILPTLCDKVVTFRLPWFKGLLCPFDFIEWINEHKNDFKPFKDAYNEVWDIEKLKEKDISIIFTESQFKMLKYYNSWEDYKQKYYKNNCSACICLEETEGDKDFKTNYQVLQNNLALTDDNMKELLAPTVKRINKLFVNRQSSINELANYYDADIKEMKSNESIKTLFEIYPELLADDDIHNKLTAKKNNIIKYCKAGKFPIHSSRPFFVPDLYAFCEYLFTDNKNAKGLLVNKQVTCNQFENDAKLDIMRNPALFVEHSINTNVRNEKTEKWFVVQDALYFSSDSLITKVLQADCDGDEVLVTGNNILVESAEKTNVDYDIVPLIYEGKKANPQKELNIDNIIESIHNAWKGNKTGIYSNDVTKVWGRWFVNEYNIDIEERKTEKEEMLKVLKWLTMECNLSIDSAKNGYVPKRPITVKNIIRKYTSKTLLPYFFQYCKDTEQPIRDVKIGVLDKIEDCFKECKYHTNVYKEYFQIERKLMVKGLIKDYDTENNKEYEKIITAYKKLNKEYASRIEKKGYKIYEECRSELEKTLSEFKFSSDTYNEP